MKLITSDKGGGQCFCPCSFMCLLARLRVLKNACMDLDEMLRVDRCQDMDKLVNFDWARFGLQSGCRNPIAFSLISYKRWYAEFYVRKIPRMHIGAARCCSDACLLKWFYSLSRRNTFVGGECAPQSALLVHIWQRGLRAASLVTPTLTSWPPHGTTSY